MDNSQQQLEHLAEMRALMERSTRFLSLSGLSGVWAGFCALAGAAAVYLYLEIGPFYTDDNYYYKALRTRKWGLDYESVFILIAILVLATALAGGLYFTTRKARRRGDTLWDPASRRMLSAMLVPLVSGGLLCLIMLKHGWIGLLAPFTLIFYGLALVSGSKYTLRDIQYLGLSEIALGLIGVYRPGFGILLWMVGFGVLHIVYGLSMYWRYDRKQ